MKTIGERVNYLRKEKGLTYNALALTLGNITADGIRKAIIRDNLSQNQISVLCEKLKWDRSWVETGDSAELDMPIYDGFQKEKPSELEALIEKKIIEIVGPMFKEIQKEQNDLRKDLTKFMLNTLDRLGPRQE